MNETAEDSYVMQMLTSPSSVVLSTSSSPLNNRVAGHRPTTIAISPEEVVMRMLDYHTVFNSNYNSMIFCLLFWQVKRK